MGMLLVLFKISLSTPGAILQPQPPPCERLVRRGMVFVGLEEGMVGEGKVSLDFASAAGRSINPNRNHEISILFIRRTLVC
jgi:hypothetical protein